MQITAKNDRILVKVLPSPRSTILAGTEDRQSRLIKGEVLSIGPKVRSEISEGDCVLFTQACREVKANRALGEDMLLIQDGDLAGILAPEARVFDGASEVIT